LLWPRRAWGALSALCGAILVVRFATITDFLIPAALVMVPLELPILYFLGFSDSPLWLLSPTSGPTMLIWGAWRQLEAWQLAYGFGYSALMLAVGFRWALGALRRYLLQGGRS
jgi:fluoroquinolone transport system permease protein